MATIVAVEFDETSCPLPPYARDIHVEEQQTRFVVSGNVADALDKADLYKWTILPDRGEATLDGDGLFDSSDDPYVMRVSLQPGQNHRSPMIQLAFQRENGGDIIVGPAISGEELVQKI